MIGNHAISFFTLEQTTLHESYPYPGLPPYYNGCLSAVEECRLAINETNAVTDPMQKLKTLFMMGKMEEVEKETARMVKDPVYRVFPASPQSWLGLADAFAAAGQKKRNCG